MPPQQLDLPPAKCESQDVFHSVFMKDVLAALSDKECVDGRLRSTGEKPQAIDRKSPPKDGSDKSSSTVATPPGDGFKFKGELFLIGGVAEKTFDDLVSKLPPDAKVVVVGMSVEGNSKAEELAAAFEDAGIKRDNIVALSDEDPPKGTKYNYTRTMPDKCDLVYFGGGDQSLLHDRFKYVDKLKQALERGAIVAGNSAGTAVMPSEMITGGDASDLTHAAGFGLLPWAITDTHVHQRQRENRDVSALYEIGKGKLPVIGIDADTRVLLRWEGGHLVGEVAGEGSVRVFKTTNQDLKVESQRTVKPELTFGTAGAGKNKSALVWELTAGDKFILQ